ncbi:MAG: hypothetical protein PHD43_20000 [Methylococcales bacterium]|nr:hypothetical protein [Methylococcales bacterium]
MDDVFDELADEHSAFDGWTILENPCDVFPAMVPTEKRIDSTMIEKPKWKDFKGDLKCAVIDEDERSPIYETLHEPFRWVCKIQVAFQDSNGSTWYSEGTGLLIEEQYVVTGAHVIIDSVKDEYGKFLYAADAVAVVVIPGLNGFHQVPEKIMPFGWTCGKAARTDSTYRSLVFRGLNPGSAQDYGLIELVEPIGSRMYRVIGDRPLGFWGSQKFGKHTIINPVNSKILKGVRVNAVGYTFDKCRDIPIGRLITGNEYFICDSSDLGSMQWVSFEDILDPGRADTVSSQIDLSNDLAPGMSGGPVWLRWKGIRNLVGIISAVGYSSGVCPERNQATRITETVLKNLNVWIRQTSEVRRISFPPPYMASPRV